MVVRVAGFGVGGKVFLSECASAADATDLGCGAQLAGQPFLGTDATRAGEGTFTVQSHAASGPLAAPTIACTDQCVIVATLGNGFAYALARSPSPLRDALTQLGDGGTCPAVCYGADVQPAS